MIDAEMREKVIRGLECCSQQRGGPELCEQCPYDNEPFPCGNALLQDALALLREQEPRVMTREEVIQSNDWIWYQLKNTHCGWTISVDCDGKWIEWEDSTTDQRCKYGKKWRCWTARPSEQQMRDTKWEEKDDSD